MDPGVVLLTLALASALALGGYGSWYGAGLYCRNCGAVRPLGPLEAAAAMMGWRPECDICGRRQT